VRLREVPSIPSYSQLPRKTAWWVVQVLLQDRDNDQGPNNLKRQFRAFKKGRNLAAAVYIFMKRFSCPSPSRPRRDSSFVLP
jgi:hypothetical protein